MIKNYELCLPVFKQGDDLYHCLKINDGKPAKSFLDLAEQYEFAAEMCRTVGKVLAKIKDQSKIEIQADTHFIGISIDEKAAHPLLKQEILVENGYFEE